MSNCFLHSDTVYTMCVCFTNSNLLRASPRAPLNTSLIVFFWQKEKKWLSNSFVSEICKDNHLLNLHSNSQICACIPPVFPLAAVAGALPGWGLSVAAWGAGGCLGGSSGRLGAFCGWLGSSGCFF